MNARPALSLGFQAMEFSSMASRLLCMITVKTWLSHLGWFWSQERGQLHLCVGIRDQQVGAHTTSMPPHMMFEIDRNIWGCAERSKLMR